MKYSIEKNSTYDGHTWFWVEGDNFVEMACMGSAIWSTWKADLPLSLRPCTTLELTLYGVPLLKAPNRDGDPL